MKKKTITLVAIALTVSMNMTAFAGQWQQDDTNWRYEQDGSYATGWQWIDGKCYYFDSNGIMAKDTVIDGYTLNTDGQWVVNGELQTRTDVGVNQTQETGNAGHSANYDPAHPLAGKIDEWNLRLSDDNQMKKTVAGWNVNAMLTNQMEQYFAAPVGDYVDSYGNHIYTTQEDYNRDRSEEQALYNWFCNWLNSFNFESMSEMERAKEIQKVLASCSYDTKGDATYANRDDRNDYYTVLVEKHGVCAEFAMTAQALAKALGLKSAVYGTGDHAVYYIQVDGKTYFGQNQVLNLNTTSPDRVYFME